jgi:hypothetical protein
MEVADFRVFQTGTSLASVEAVRSWRMVELSPAQRRMLIDKLPDAANLAVGGTVFGQFLSDRPFSVGAAVLGLFAWAALLGIALALGQESKP